MLLIEDRRGEAPRASVSVQEMGKFARELGERGILRGAAGPLRPDSEAVRVSLKGGRASVTDGPFAEAREVVGGYFAIDVADRAAAIEVAALCPYARAGAVEVRAMRSMPRDEATGGPQFVLLFLLAADAPVPDAARLAEGMAQMRAVVDELRREGKHLAGAGLPPEPPAARVEIRGEKVFVRDGPFAESKEVTLGFALVQAPNRAAAIETAKRIPHAGWGSIEVREVGPLGAA
ncbi:MAG: YciI family protein [Myxococcota bacterium]